MTEDTVFWWRLIATNEVKLENFCGVKYRRGTEGCRDKPENLAKWGESLFYAVNSNVNFWINRGNRFTSPQMANLVNVLAGFGQKSGDLGEHATQSKAYLLADEFLKASNSSSLMLLPWKWLGVNRVVMLKMMLIKTFKIPK